MLGGTGKIFGYQTVKYISCLIADDSLDSNPPQPDPTCKVDHSKRKWKSADFKPDLRDVAFEPDADYTEKVQEFKESSTTPVELFETFFDKELIGLMKDESVRYAGQKNATVTFDENDMYRLITILLISGYCQLPRRRMYWELANDVHNEIVASIKRRNRFEELMRYFHLANNDELDSSDKFAKLRPFFDMLNDKFLKAFLEKDLSRDLSIDESMCPYPAKQFIRGKPIRVGFKLWSLNSSSGYQIQFIPYQGKMPRAEYKQFGMGGSVVLALLKPLPQLPWNVFFDNLFSSLKLIDELSHQRILGTGTIRENRIENCPIKSSAEIKKKPRGFFDQRCEKDGHAIVVRWNDNNAVSLVSNVYGVRPIGKVSRWSKTQSKYIQVKRPDIVDHYNNHMGGVDKMDQNISAYCVQIRSKKWWWPLWAIDTAIQNSWILYRNTQSGKDTPLDLLSFRRWIANFYTRKYLTPVEPAEHCVLCPAISMYLTSSAMMASVTILSLPLADPAVLSVMVAPHVSVLNAM